MESNGQNPGVMDALREIQRTQSLLMKAVETLSGKSASEAIGIDVNEPAEGVFDPQFIEESKNGQTLSQDPPTEAGNTLQAPSLPSPDQREQGFTSRIILT